jgi:hypothetical protein
MPLSLERKRKWFKDAFGNKMFLDSEEKFAVVGVTVAKEGNRCLLNKIPQLKVGDDSVVWIGGTCSVLLNFCEGKFTKCKTRNDAKVELKAGSEYHKSLNGLLNGYFAINIESDINVIYFRKLHPAYYKSSVDSIIRGDKVVITWNNSKVFGSVTSSYPFSSCSTHSIAEFVNCYAVYDSNNNAYVFAVLKPFKFVVKKEEMYHSLAISSPDSILLKAPSKDERLVSVPAAAIKGRCHLFHACTNDQRKSCGKENQNKIIHNTDNEYYYVNNFNMLYNIYLNK